MKFIAVLVFALIAVVAADVSHLNSGSNDLADPSSEAVNREYLPPFRSGRQASALVNREYLPPFQMDGSDPEPAHTLDADGYKYKTPARRFRY